MSREKQIELLEKQLAFWKHHCTVLSNALTKEEEISNRYAEMLDKTEEELNAERVKQEWISVEEGLPTEQKEFLAYYGFDNNGDGDLGMMFTGVLTYFAYDKKPHFQHEDLRLRVTHWMPLPEPPKMKGGAE